VNPKELDRRREAAQRDAERVKRAAPRIHLLNTPLHRNLDGERGGELDDDEEVGVEPKRVQGPNAER
jgi:hypothetical protein